MADFSATAVGATGTNAKACHSGVYPHTFIGANANADLQDAGDASSLSVSVILHAIPIQSGTRILQIIHELSLSASAQALKFGLSGVDTNQFGSLTGQAGSGVLSKNLPYQLSLSDDAAEPRVAWITVAGLAGTGGRYSITALLTRDID